MYSIFSNKTKKHRYLEEGEPPPKKIISEGDILIKKLAEKQLKTTTNLKEQLNQSKQFQSSEKFTSITSFVSGTKDLNDFQNCITNIDEINSFKRKNLSDKDIELYKDYESLGREVRNKYKNVPEEILVERINNIEELFRSNKQNESNTSSTSRHQEDYLNSLKPDSIETKLLKFAVENGPRDLLPSPMDQLSNIEKGLMGNIEKYSSCDVKNIRKKARSMGNKIKRLEEKEIDFPEGKGTATGTKKNDFKFSSWDVQEKPKCLEKKIEIIDKSKKYGCKEQNWYTIKEGKIVNLIGKNSRQIVDDTKSEIACKAKLTLEEIKKLPKFMNYDPGIPAKVLFLKNLSQNITENSFKDLLKEFPEDSYSVKVMCGRMRGQAFIEFQNDAQSKKAMNILNGVVINSKPIIVVYGKRKDSFS